MATKQSSKIPKFNNDQEAALFWDTHDSAQYFNESKPANIIFPKPKHLLITLNTRQMSVLKRLANKIGVSYDNLVQQWIIEKLGQGIAK